jgi:hypothetical protein
MGKPNKKSSAGVLDPSRHVDTNPTVPWNYGQRGEQIIATMRFLCLRSTKEMRDLSLCFW